MAALERSLKISGFMGMTACGRWEPVNFSKYFWLECQVSGNFNIRQGQIESWFFIGFNNQRNF
jgi:hypothetical protein